MTRDDVGLLWYVLAFAVPLGGFALGRALKLTWGFDVLVALLTLWVWKAAAQSWRESDK